MWLFRGFLRAIPKIGLTRAATHPMLIGRGRSVSGKKIIAALKQALAREAKETVYLVVPPRLYDKATREYPGVKVIAGREIELDSSE